MMLKRVGILFLILEVLLLNVDSAELKCYTEIVCSTEEITRPGWVEINTSAVQMPNPSMKETGTPSEPEAKFGTSILDQNEIRGLVSDHVDKAMAKKCKTLILDLCPILYDGKCFVPITGKPMPFKMARKRCKALGGLVANIYSEEHMEMIMQYIREHLMGGVEWADFFLGMNVKPETANVTLRDGTPAPFVKWQPSYPDYWSPTKRMFLVINKDPNEIQQYFANATPEYHRTPICEI